MGVSEKMDYREAVKELVYKHYDPDANEQEVYHAILALLDKVRATELEKVATWLPEHGFSTGHGDTIEDLLKELAWQITERLDKVRQAQAAEIGKLAKNWRDREQHAGCKGEASVYPLLADELEAALGRK